MLAGTGMFALGGMAGCATGDVEEAPPLPWKWINLDPLETGRKAYRLYRKGGCGTGAYLGLLSMLKEKVGYPWTVLPDNMFAHGGGGYGGHGTLCGALGGSACIINLVAYEKGKDAIYRRIIDRLQSWYAGQEFPTDRFDDISPIPGQPKVRAMSPLCHTSSSKWALAAGVEVTSEQKNERCAKVTGEVAYNVVLALNDYFAGRRTVPAWKPPEQVEHCVGCHGPNADGPNNQQGHMECTTCHDDHTKA
jgi:hypothetical protein